MGNISGHFSHVPNAHPFIHIGCVHCWTNFGYAGYDSICVRVCVCVSCGDGSGGIGGSGSAHTTSTLRKYFTCLTWLPLLTTINRIATAPPPPRVTTNMHSIPFMVCVSRMDAENTNSNSFICIIIIFYWTATVDALWKWTKLILCSSDCSLACEFRSFLLSFSICLDLEGVGSVGGWQLNSNKQFIYDFHFVKIFQWNLWRWTSWSRHHN